MIRSTDHIRTMHAGTLPRPPELLEMVVAKSRGEPVDEPVLTDKLRTVIAENVGLQLETGIDSVNDGEVSKVTFTSYISERMSGIERRTPRDGPAPPGINGRDMWEFSGYFAGRGGFTGSGSNPSFFCVGPDCLQRPGRHPGRQRQFQRRPAGLLAGGGLPARRDPRHDGALARQRVLPL